MGDRPRVSQGVKSDSRLPFPLLDVMPPVLRDVMLDFVWDRERLWGLDLPVTRVPIERVAWQLRLPMWAHDGVPFVLTPRQVARDPLAFSQQYARTLAADMSFPLHVLERGRRLTVLDGMHRLLRAQVKGHSEVLVKALPFERLDDIACFAPTPG
jgi:hypothetical protein